MKVDNIAIYIVSPSIGVLFLSETMMYVDKQLCSVVGFTPIPWTSYKCSW